MKNTFGSNIKLTLFGESHGEAIGAVLDGLPAGLPVNEEYIASCMRRRAAYGKISTARREADAFSLVSGVYNSRTTGSPITAVIRNTDTRSSDYEKLSDTPRPAHADYTAAVRYHGFSDPRGGGHFSGRLTAPVVCLGSLVRYVLSLRGITLATHIKSLFGICDDGFSGDPREAELLLSHVFPTLSEETGRKMTEKIEEAAARGDSVGGILEGAIYGLPAGVGEPFFDSLEGVLAHGLFAIPGVKGVEFGLGFGYGTATGSEVNDPFIIRDGRVATRTNNCGGVLGGLSNGEPIIYRVAMKPTPSISLPQRSVNIRTSEETEITVHGRHDPAIVHRAAVVCDSVVALAVCDLLASRYGSDAIAEGLI